MAEIKKRDGDNQKGEKNSLQSGLKLVFSLMRMPVDLNSMQ